MVEQWLAGQQMVERGWIIVILCDQVVGPADASMVRRAMSLLGVPVDGVHFRNHLAYLEERGYVRIEHKTVGQMSNTLLSVTADGRDLRAGVRTDAGVDVAVGSAI